MLTRIDLQNFKCFDKLHLPLKPLTLLSGLNASGKSSILQSLVLLHQTMREHEWSNRLMLNGNALRLGTVSDVVDKLHGRRNCGIGIVDDKQSYEWTFDGERADMSMTVEKVSIGNEQLVRPASLRFLLPPNVNKAGNDLAKRIRSLTYITAERAGPREVYSLEDRQIATVVGPEGEHTLSLMHWGRDEGVLEGLVMPNVPATRLRQIEERMRLFFPGCGLVVQQVPQANAVTLGLRTSEETDFHRPIHVGFGLTQVLPIVVAALSATRGEILLIENPEVHLHPAGQGIMGQFLGDVVNAGIQVIVETHSDHVLNGIRRSIKRQSLHPIMVAIHFFRARPTDSQVLSPILDQNGNLDSWPDGFFDQFDKDASYLAGWGQ